MLFLTIEMLFLTPESDFFEFREPRFLWRGALFGAEVAASDFKSAFAQARSALEL
jgi:hypothetical protein